MDTAAPRRFPARRNLFAPRVSDAAPATNVRAAESPAPSTEELRIAAGNPRRLIGSSELSVYPVALGANVFGWSVDARSSAAILDAFLDGGGTFIDTADSYAGGRSEHLIGSWMRRRRVRDQIVLATKVGKSPDFPGLAPRTLTSAVEASLRRLDTDHIDLLYLHVDDPDVEFEQTLIAVDRLVRSGKVRAFGGSDHTGMRLLQARVACALMGVAPMVAVQQHYNLVHRAQYETSMAEVAAAQGLGVMPRYALASGYLTGKYRSRASVLASRRQREVAPYVSRRGQRVLGVLDALSEQTGAVPATIALAWLLSRPNVTAPVASATRVEHVAPLLAAPRLVLSRSQLTELDRASAY